LGCDFFVEDMLNIQLSKKNYLIVYNRINVKLIFHKTATLSAGLRRTNSN